MATSATDTTSHDKLLKAFIHNGWWGKHWEEKVTRAVLSTPFNGDYKVFTKKENENVHAEEKVLDHLRDLLTTAPEDAVITLFLSYSPCDDCCPRIKRFLDEHKDKKLQLHVVFSALYRIDRPSFGGRRKNYDQDQDHAKDDNSKNLKALQGLYQEMGDNLRPFNDKDWTDLQNVLGITNSEIDKRKKEDRLRQDFETLMASH
ncbi:uncharacterized protein LOC112568283 [Pomacea canaliculata]|uniref:uncharacterized protein LOC112568283 n=1 Tax=Pomacea canaliculata TaxID=400727 RepID=UPI000D73CA6A|nr:uncharacterized protein LOC112568283 [Pomacea canaliculata]